ncbi:trifunctional serine/threonine-protein kinase/ATP-binding protein/sensor histidine kinase [Desulfogranum mediterraneum]|uniref:trifunctional serine/threonine-protein kinase/ATP-binding protein/sensor histidine kinase n=1 Tax=Desulfogranum mediterraneum TaxID=160661 RepID=UPI0004208648|nr:AAA family ATPase [Desulfogranum mediterraneum]
MLNIEGIEIHEEILNQGHFRLHRAVHLSSGSPLLVKLSSLQALGQHSPGQLSREFELIRLFHSDLIVTAYSLRQHREQELLLLEDIKGVPLSQLSTHREPLKLGSFLKLALQLTRALVTIHGKALIHNRIRPDAIFYNPDSGQLQVIDFSRACRLDPLPEPPAGEQLLGEQRTDQKGEQLTSAFAPIASLHPSQYPAADGQQAGPLPSSARDQAMVEELSYASPEYSRRPGRQLDCTSDLYSLGVLLYELLTGTLPFTSQDPLQLAHAHLASRPSAPHSLNPEIPLTLSRIILKLLEKFPANRYQSAVSLQLDLQHGLDDLSAANTISSFEPGCQGLQQRDRSATLHGRELELDQLHQGYAAARRKPTSLIRVSGSAGTGKTALVQAFKDSLAQESVFFLSGKFDQYQRETPFAPLVQCLRELTQLLLGLDQVGLESWKKKILKALGPNARVVIDVIPDLVLVTGRQPELPLLDPTETKTRFERSLKQFIGVIASEDTPLILFLDDMQWADPASLALLDLFLSDQSNRGLLVIAAYRHDELTADHSLRTLIQRNKIREVTLQAIRLHDFSLTQVKTYLERLLPDDCTFLHQLAGLCLEKTNGNPFFLDQFIRTLFHEGHLQIDPESKQWYFDKVQISGSTISENVATLILNRFNQLAPECRQLLQLTACLGNSCSRQTLLRVSELSPEQLDSHLQQAVAQGFLLERCRSDEQPSGSGRPAEGRSGTSETMDPSYTFSHDQIRQAVYLEPDPETRQGYHLTIGRRLLQADGDQYQPRDPFIVASHLNQGHQLLQDREERCQLAALNLQAGQAAFSTVAYDWACSYLETGLALLPEDAWTGGEYQLCLDLHIDCAEAMYLNGSFGSMQKLVLLVEEHARCLLDTIRIYEIEIQALTARNKLNQAVDRALTALRLLDEEIPTNPSKLDLVLAYLKTRYLLRGKESEELLDLPKMENPHKQAAMQILYRIGTAAYYKGADFLALVACKTVQLSLKHGNTSHAAAVGYATFAIMECGLVGDINHGYACGLVALKLQDRFVAQSILPATQFIFANLIQHWKEPLEATLGPLKEAYHHALELGETEHAALALYSYNNRLFQLGSNLEVLAEKMAKSRNILEQIGQEIMTSRQAVAQQAVENLLDPTAEPTRFSGRHYDEEAMIPRHLESGDQTTLFQLYVFSLSQAFLLGEHSWAEAVEEKAWPLVQSSISSAFLPQLYFFSSLTKIQLLAKDHRRSARPLKRKIQANQKKLSTWARHAPCNFLHLFELVQAERYRLAGEDSLATELYEQAIANARQHDFIHYEALAYELAASFYLDKGMELIGTTYLQEAFSRYRSWGAAAKTTQLAAKYSQLGSQPLQALPALAAGTGQDEQGPSGQLSSLDMITMVKTSHALAKEIKLGSFLKSMLEIMMEHAGAEQGMLFLEREEEWLVKIKGRVQGGVIQILQDPVEISSQPLAPQSMVNYVARTRERIILDNAASSTMFRGDAYISSQQSRSVYCAPVLTQDRVICILFLENNLLSGAFSRKQGDLLQYLGYQAAISLRNSILYAELEETVGKMDQEIKKHQQTQRQLLHSEKLSAIGRITASIAHEFGNPLLGLKFLISDIDKHEQLSPKRRQLLEIGLKECSRLQALIRKLRQVSHPSSGEAEPCDIQLILRDTLLFYQKLLESANILLQTHFLPDLPPCKAVKDQITQVATNLILNGVDATRGKGGELIISTWCNGEYLFFSVADNGQGISREDQKQIFEPFFSTKPEVEGTGLGLSVSYGIITAHGGTISVESDPGKGSCFTVKLPQQQ